MYGPPHVENLLEISLGEKKCEMMNHLVDSDEQKAILFS